MATMPQTPSRFCKGRPLAKLSAALAVVLDDRWVQDVEKGLRQANARQVVAEKIATGAAAAPHS